MITESYFILKVIFNKKVRIILLSYLLKFIIMNQILVYNKHK